MPLALMRNFQTPQETDDSGPAGASAFCYNFAGNDHQFNSIGTEDRAKRLTHNGPRMCSATGSRLQNWLAHPLAAPPALAEVDLRIGRVHVNGRWASPTGTILIRPSARFLMSGSKWADRSRKPWVSSSPCSALPSLVCS